jgi:hypothetical protein
MFSMVINACPVYATGCSDARLTRRRRVNIRSVAGQWQGGVLSILSTVRTWFLKERTGSRGTRRVQMVLLLYNF